ncbi:MAG: tRNA dihydrouridine synthase [Planctomycetota bacterium]|jgi:tRNA-dihydrouridine synthase
MHARSAAQLYNGDADWSRIADLKSRMSIPVLGNGDIFEAFDALRMMRETGADGVVIGRACLGRPWLFRDLVDAFDGREPEEPPRLSEVVAVALEHAALLIEFFGERTAMLHMRKFGGWYLKSFPGAKKLLPDIHRVESIDSLRELMAQLPADEPYPLAALRVRRGKTGRTQKFSLPDGYLADRERDEAPAGAEESQFEGG